MKELVHIMVIFDNLGVGGVQTKILSLSRWFESQKHSNVHLHIILKNTSAFNRSTQIHSTKTTLHYKPAWSFGPVYVPYSLYIFWKTLTIKPDTILTFYYMLSMYAVICSRLIFWKKIRVVLNEDVYTSKQHKSIIKWFIIHTFYPLGFCTISPTTAARNDLIHSFSLPPEKIITIPNWTLMPRSTNSLAKTIDILFAGRFDDQKGIPCLLRTIRALALTYPNLQAALVGEGPKHNFITSFVNKHHLSNNIILYESTDNIANFLNRAKIIIHCSSYEGMSLFLLEAMAMGIPILATWHEGIAEYLIHKKTAIIAYSKISLVSYAKKLLGNPSYRTRLGANAAKDVRRRFSSVPLSRFTSILTQDL